MNSKKYIPLILFITFSFFSLHSQIIQKKHDLPQFGNWLLLRNGEAARWLGKKYKGKMLFEPINVIIIDKYSKSPLEAIEKLMKECKQNGYGEEFGHTSGYYGEINNILYPQIPNNKHMAFSNRDFLFTNNHGRIMGPAFFNNQYFFIGAFSREKLKISYHPSHEFLSFNLARDDFYHQMGNGSMYKMYGYYILGNIENTFKATTADHDGKVCILYSKK